MVSKKCILFYFFLFFINEVGLCSFKKFAICIYHFVSHLFLHIVHFSFFFLDNFVLICMLHILITYITNRYSLFNDY